MKKLILALTLSVFTLGLQADEAKPCKDAKPACKQASACKKSSGTKEAPKVESPKGAEQIKK